MKQKTFALLLMIALALCLGLACTPAVTATVKIMPLGDSLTKGLTDTTEAARATRRTGTGSGTN